MRDLASIVREVEILPWDEWGPMEDSYNDKTGEDFDNLIDQLAGVALHHDQPELEAYLRATRRADLHDPLTSLPWWSPRSMRRWSTSLGCGSWSTWIYFGGDVAYGPGRPTPTRRADEQLDDVRLVVPL
jgi:hypothetical protein